MDGTAVALGVLLAEAEVVDEGVSVYETLRTVATLDRVWMLEMEREMDRVVSTGMAVAMSVNVTVGTAEATVFVPVDVAEAWVFVALVSWAKTWLGSARAARPTMASARRETSMAGIVKRRGSSGRAARTSWRLCTPGVIAGFAVVSQCVQSDKRATQE
jgi:hypothetical protein